MAAVDLDGAAGERPQGAVVDVGCFVDATAWEGGLVSRWAGERGREGGSVHVTNKGMCIGWRVF